VEGTSPDPSYGTNCQKRNKLSDSPGIYFPRFAHNATAFYYIFKSVLEVIIWNCIMVSYLKRSGQFLKSILMILFALQRQHSLFSVGGSSSGGGSGVDGCDVESDPHTETSASASSCGMACRRSSVAFPRPPGGVVWLLALTLKLLQTGQVGMGTKPPPRTARRCCCGHADI
jgi:hypothetical protein